MVLFSNHPNTVVQCSKSDLMDYKVAHLGKSRISSTRSDQQQRWEALPKDIIKINWDSAVDRTHCKIGIGIVVQDWKGRVLTAMRKKQDCFPVQEIIKIHLPQAVNSHITHMTDKPIWVNHHSGNVFVKSAYNFIISQQNSQPISNSPFSKSDWKRL